MTPGDYETIEFDVAENRVATITLDRPEKLNSFNRTMADEVSDVWGRVRDDDAIHAVVLRASGDRAFCTGIDIKEGVWWYDRSIWVQEDPAGYLGPRHHNVWKPVIAAVHGMCAGGGQYFINQCDIIICSDDAVFFDPHANGGVVSAIEPIGLLHRGVPLGDVLRWALMGNEERIGPDTALRLGIVSEVVTRADLWTRANAIAEGIARRRPKAIQGTVRAIWEAIQMPPAMALKNGILCTHIGNERDPDETSVRYDSGGDVEIR